MVLYQEIDLKSSNLTDKTENAQKIEILQASRRKLVSCRVTLLQVVGALSKVMEQSLRKLEMLGNLRRHVERIGGKEHEENSRDKYIERISEVGWNRKGTCMKLKSSWQEN